MKNIKAIKMMIELNDVRCLLIGDEIYCRGRDSFFEGIVENIELIIRNNKKIKIMSLEEEEFLKCHVDKIKQGENKIAIVTVQLFDDKDDCVFVCNPTIQFK